MDQINTPSSASRRGLIRWAVREGLGVIMVAVLLFVSAGRLDWGMGWALVGLYALWVAALAFFLIPTNPDVLIERAERKKSDKTWDTVLLSLLGFSTMTKYIVAGLDYRLDWSSGLLPVWLQLLALLAAGLGYALLTWSMISNAFFALVVRIQRDRGQTVAQRGPYRWLRHPGYSGSIVFELVTPLALGSLWALIPGLVGALVLIVRTALEDKTLQGELDGYRDYARRVRYRLLPGVW